jgi:hypothetical protein
MVVGGNASVADDGNFRTGRLRRGATLMGAGVVMRWLPVELEPCVRVAKATAHIAHPE